jgi:hypothetical protein
LQRRKENVVYVNDDHVIVVVSIYKSCLTMEETLPDKGILEKPKKRREGLGLLYNH